MALDAGLADRIAAWISAKVASANCRGAVVGLSGGIDSSVVAALCKRAMGDNVLGVIMPCGSGEADAAHAALLADALSVETLTVPLDEALAALKQALPPGSEMADANIKPRLRMAALYHVAQARGYLVAGTGNRSEILIGYFTKWGDGGVDMEPIGSIYKHEVRELAAQIGIPREIIARPPSAGLWEAQTDEGELGMTYDELDRALAVIEGEADDDSLAPALLEKVRALVAASAHKRAMPEIPDLPRRQ